MNQTPTITNQQEYNEATSTVVNMALEYMIYGLKDEQKIILKTLAEECIRYREANNLEQ